MLVADGAFRERVAAFESAHGPLEGDALAVAVQANYLCWFEAEFPESLIRVGEAICTGRPRPMTSCGQVSPERWRDLHHYVVAVQRWLGDGRPVPGTLSEAKVARLAGLLGERTPARAALAELYIASLVEHLLGASLGQLSGDGTTDGPSYDDYSSWYRRRDGGLYRREGADDFVEERSQAAREAMADRPGETGTLLDRLLEMDRPPCVQRFARYQEVRLASVGALRWQGDLPPDEKPRRHWESIFADAGTALDHWVGGAPASSELGRRLHAALGPRDSRKLGLVTSFLIPPPSSSRAFDWLEAHARKEGRKAGIAFGIPGFPG